MTPALFLDDEQKASAVIDAVESLINYKGGI